MNDQLPRTSSPLRAGGLLPPGAAVLSVRHAGRKDGQRGRIAATFTVLFLSLMGLVGLPAPQAQAASYRCPAFVTWQDWVGGARVHAYVDFRSSDICQGRHVRTTYVRLIRRCGPAYDTGRLYTSSGSWAGDGTLRSTSVWIFDSPWWGCRTDTYYGYELF